MIVVACGEMKTEACLHAHQEKHARIDGLSLALAIRNCSDRENIDCKLQSGR